MNYGDHNFIEITQQTKLRVEPVELDFVECDIVSVENVQRSLQNIFLALLNIATVSVLSFLQLPSLELCRLHFDLIY